MRRRKTRKKRKRKTRRKRKRRRKRRKNMRTSRKRRNIHRKGKIYSFKTFTSRPFFSHICALLPGTYFFIEFLLVLNK